MAFPVAGSTPQLSGSVVPNVLWSTRLLVKFYAATVLGEIANTEYEGEISDYGDSVTIRTTPDIVISNYSKGQNLNTQRPEPSTIDLKIDQGRYWQFVADDVDKLQSDYDFIDDWANDASMQLKINIDTTILGTIYADAHAANQGSSAGAKSGSINLGTTGAPVKIDKTNIVDKIVDVRTVLKEQNVPESDMFIILPPAMCARILKSDLKDASLSGDGTSILRNGRVGMVAGMTVYESNLLSTTVDSGTTVTNIIAGQKSGLTFASQLVKNETLKAESTFGTLVRGLQVFGYKVVKPEAIVHLYAY